MARAFLIILLVSGLLLTPAYAETPGVRVFLHGTELKAHARPILMDGRALMPIDWFHEYLGGHVGCYKSVCTAGDGRAALQFEVGSRRVKMNGRPYELDVPVVTRDGERITTIYVPLRFVVLMLGGQVTWDAKASEVHIAGPMVWPAPTGVANSDEILTATRRLCALQVVRCEPNLGLPEGS